MGRCDPPCVPDSLARAWLLPFSHIAAGVPARDFQVQGTPSACFHRKAVRLIGLPASLSIPTQPQPVLSGCLGRGLWTQTACALAETRLSFSLLNAECSGPAAFGPSWVRQATSTGLQQSAFFIPNPMVAPIFQPALSPPAGDPVEVGGWIAAWQMEMAIWQPQRGNWPSCPVPCC